MRDELKAVLSKWDERTLICEIKEPKVSYQINGVDLLFLGVVGEEGLARLSSMRQANAATHVAILSVNTDERLAARYLSMGASAYLLTDTMEDELPHAIQSMERGGKYLSVELAYRVADRICKSAMIAGVVGYPMGCQ
ncbi:MAG: response regulator transcription factor [Magnetococcales bacterium]|nr:response regulator transcription factor [Magnetococcales bacterium]